MLYRILVVDDEPHMRQLLTIYLKNAGYAVEEANDGLTALEQVETETFHLVVLDLMMPGMSGWDACKAIREVKSEMPILMLTARTSVEDKVTGLSIGADDYLTKPFDGRELVARVQALLRRSNPEEGQTYRFDEYDILIDPEGRTVSVTKKPLSLTPKEFDVLLLMAKRPGRTYSRDEILERIWGYDYYGDTRTVDSHVKNIREKLRDAGVTHDPIKTIWGIGYKFEV